MLKSNGRNRPTSLLWYYGNSSRAYKEQIVGPLTSVFNALIFRATDLSLERKNQNILQVSDQPTCITDRGAQDRQPPEG
jgi:hypothetical protein